MKSEDNVSIWKRRLSFAGLVFTVLIAVGIGYQFNFTGFQSKTLWDWIQVIFLPIVLFALPRYYSSIQKQIDDEKQHNREQAEIVQAFVDSMTKLILENNLLEADEQTPVSTIARTLTLTTFRRLEAPRKATILKFITESKLIQGYNTRIINLTGADLSGIGQPLGLVKVDLEGADLRWTNFTKAILTNATFYGAHLEGATLDNGEFLLCDFRGAILNGVSFAGANLWGAKFDETTILPNNQNWSENTDMTVFGAIIKAPYSDKELAELRKEYGIEDEQSTGD